MKPLLVTFFALFLFAGQAFAQGHPAAQHSGAAHNWNIVFDEGRWIDLNRVTIKMPEQKDLFITVTFDCGLLEGGQTPFADAVLRLVATVDGKDAAPGRFEACGKTNELARFANTVPCTEVNGWAHWRDCGVAGVQEEQLRRSLRTRTATFIAKDVGVGVHEIVVKTYLWNGDTANPVRGVVGSVSLEAEIVRLIRTGR